MKFNYTNSIRPRLISHCKLLISFLQFKSLICVDKGNRFQNYRLCLRFELKSQLYFVYTCIKFAIIMAKENQAGEAAKRRRHFQVRTIAEFQIATIWTWPVSSVCSFTISYPSTPAGAVMLTLLFTGRNRSGGRTSLDEYCTRSYITCEYWVLS